MYILRDIVLLAHASVWSPRPGQVLAGYIVPLAYRVPGSCSQANMQLKLILPCTYGTHHRAIVLDPSLGVYSGIFPYLTQQMISLPRSFCNTVESDAVTLKVPVGRCDV